MVIRGFVFDFDSTIAPEHQPFGHRTLASLQADMDEAGVRNICLTGRSPDYVVGPHGMNRPQDVSHVAAVIGDYGGSVWYPKEDVLRPLAPLVGPDLSAALLRCGIPVRSILRGPCSVMVREPFASRARDAFALANTQRQANGMAPFHVEAFGSQWSVCFLPTGVSKEGAFVDIVAGEMGLRKEELVGAGDSEADAGFLMRCAYAIVPENASPRLLERLRGADVKVIYGRGQNAAGTFDGLHQMMVAGVRFGSYGRGLVA